jgi:hypothetical protein
MNFLQSINNCAVQPVNDYVMQPAISFAQEHPYITTTAAAIGTGVAFAPGLVLIGITTSIGVMQTTATFVTAHPFITAFTSVPAIFGVGIGLLGFNPTTEIAKECVLQQATIDIPSSVVPKLLFVDALYSIGVSSPFFVTSCMAGKIGYEYCDNSDLSRTVCSSVARGVIGGFKYIEIAYAERSIISTPELIIIGVTGFSNNGGYALMSSTTKMVKGTVMPVIETLSSIPLEFSDVVVEVVGKWYFGQELGENINAGCKALFQGAVMAFFSETLYAKATGNDFFPTFRNNGSVVKEKVSNDSILSMDKLFDSSAMCLIGGNEAFSDTEVPHF